MEHKYNEKEKECNYLKDELSKIKEKGTNDYMKSSINYEMDKKNLMDKINELKQQHDEEKIQ